MKIKRNIPKINRIEKIKKFINEFMSMIKKENISMYSAGASYFLILSFIPLSMLFVSLINFTEITKEQILRFTSDLFPDIIHLIVTPIINEVYEKSAVSISFSAFFALWSSGKAIIAFKNGMHSIAHIKTEKNYFFLRVGGMVDTILFVVILIISLIFIVSGEKIEESEYLNKLFSRGFTGTVIGLRKLIVFIMSVFIFLVSYKILPDWERSEFICDEKIKIYKLLPGALFSAVGWYAYSFVFSLYLKYSHSFVDMYGSLAILTGVMLWLYGSMYIILMGFEVNVVLLNKNCLG